MPGHLYQTMGMQCLQNIVGKYFELRRLEGAGGVEGGGGGGRWRGGLPLGNAGRPNPNETGRFPSTLMITF